MRKGRSGETRNETRNNNEKVTSNVDASRPQQTIFRVRKNKHCVVEATYLFACLRDAERLILSRIGIFI